MAFLTTFQLRLIIFGTGCVGSDPLARYESFKSPMMPTTFQENAVEPTGPLVLHLVGR